MAKPKSYKWTFTARFRTNAFGWNGSRLACKRIKEAVSEIKKITRKDPQLGAGGAIRLMEKLWPAFQRVDTSSGALGTTVYNATEVLVDIVIDAPVDEKTRLRWLDRLWDAVSNDGVDYLNVREKDGVRFVALLKSHRNGLMSGCRSYVIPGPKQNEDRIHFLMEPIHAYPVY